jgi:hypothetical protein
VTAAVTQTGDPQKWKPGDLVYGVYGKFAHIVRGLHFNVYWTYCGRIIGSDWQGNDLFSETIATCRRCKNKTST